ncbi:ribonuclease H-like domain-containing protein [Tanacetum coccineum]
MRLTKSSKDSLEQPKDVRPSAPIVEEWESDSDDDCMTRPSIEQNKPSYAEINFVKSDKNTRKSVIEQNTYRQAEHLRKSQTCFVCGSLNHLIKDCNFYENKMVVKSVLNNMGRVTSQMEVRLVWNNAQRVNHQNKLEHPLLKRNLFQQQLQTKCGLVPVNAAKQASRVAASICTARACYTNALYQSEAGPEVVEVLKEVNLTRKGKIRTGKLDFEDVYFVKELKFNLFPVSQMCDKKNSILFTETECLVLSPNFKLLDESQVLLKVHRQDNMYSFDLKNVVPSGDPLGKFDGKADEGFLVGYSINSKAFRVFNTRTKKVEENLHINFLENKPNVAGSGPESLFDIDSLTKSMNYEPVTVRNQTNGDDDISQRNGQEKEGGASNKEDDQHVQDFRAELDNLLVQQKKGYANNTNRDSTASLSVSTAGLSINTASENINNGSLNINTASPIPNDSSMQSLENTSIFNGAYDDEDVGAEADLNNLETTMNVSPIPTTRIYKDHPKDQIIGT